MSVSSLTTEPDANREPMHPHHPTQLTTHLPSTTLSVIKGLDAIKAIRPHDIFLGPRQQNRPAGFLPDQEELHVQWNTLMIALATHSCPHCSPERRSAVFHFI